jgi:hypothetical protein
MPYPKDKSNNIQHATKGLAINGGNLLFPV